MKYDDEQLRSAFRRTDGCCHICGKKLAFYNYGAFGTRGCWEIEHSVAQATGGGDHGNNRYPACISCNREKRAGSTRSARAKYGRTAAPLSAAKKVQLRRRNAFLAGAGGGLTAVALGASGPVGWAIAGFGALVGHGMEPDSAEAQAEAAAVMLSDSQRAAYRFLRLRAQDEDAFTAGDIERVAAWGPGSFTTYKTKHLKEYVTTVGQGSYTIKPHFLRLSEDEFHGIVSQSRRTVARFVRTVFDAVLKYEFLLPLTNERKLRSALDELFYRDHLVQRAKEIGGDALATILPRTPSESTDAFLDRVVTKVGSLLGGYSIGHVNGRFRASGLKTHQEAAQVLADRGRYLVDETTAVVRFLLPLEVSRTSHGSHFDVAKHPSVDVSSLADELEIARRLFIVFFVESVILDIHVEDEIWFLESGPGGERLYVLERQREHAAEPRTEEHALSPTEQLALPLATPLDTWLRNNGYAEVADDISEIEGGWKKNGVKTRKNWWDVLAGNAKGQPREVAGVKFPVIAAIRKRQGLPRAAGAISQRGEKPLPK